MSTSDIKKETREMAELYPYQENDLNTLFELLSSPDKQRLLYQLPTGGGKTRVFSAITERYIQAFGKQVMVLTHRIELCRQTSVTLKKMGIRNLIIDSTVKQLPKAHNRLCYVAMVETLKNRINDGLLDPSTIGLVIIDEAHHNSFHKLLGHFTNASIIGVTATPLSSDSSLPMYKHYDQLLVGESIQSLIESGYLARPKTWRYDVELNSLKINNGGDFTISASDELYSSPAMLDLLLHAYEAHSKNKKTLIFNAGIFTSKKVCEHFHLAGYDVRHLDNHTPAAERAQILSWFKRTKRAILTSVSILTTGFDEPTVQTIVLNRATTSLTLFHQMIGRGSRRLPDKKTFNIIDLGNNSDRFGNWSQPLDWQEIFRHPEAYAESIHLQLHQAHHLDPELRAEFSKSLNLHFDIQQAYQETISKGLKPKLVIRDAIRQHVKVCLENAETLAEALALADGLEKEIAWRCKQYGKCLGKVTKNYVEWLQTDYQAKLQMLIKKLFQRKERLLMAG